jgi:hypothetical protein
LVKGIKYYKMSSEIKDPAASNSEESDEMISPAGNIEARPNNSATLPCIVLHNKLF